jgi:glutathione S-transferase
VENKAVTLITLYGMPSAGGLKQLSPFVVKVEMALLYLGLEYEVEHLDPLKIRSMSPTGKVPWIRMGKSTLSESDSIIAFLNSKQDADLLDDLTNDQRVLGLALKRLTEDHLYWLMVWARWISDASRLALVESFLESFLDKYPKPIIKLASPFAKRHVSALCKTQGIGLMSDDEREREAMIDFNALSAQLKKMPFLLGSDMTVYDFSVAAVLSGILFFRPNNWLTDMANDFEIFSEYLGRVSERLGGYEFVKD